LDDLREASYVIGEHSNTVARSGQGDVPAFVTNHLGTLAVDEKQRSQRALSILDGQVRARDRRKTVVDDIDEEAASDIVTRLVGAVSEMMDLLLVLAAPRLQAIWVEGKDAPPVRAELLVTIDRFNHDWTRHGARVQGPPSFPVFVAMLPSIRSDVEQWVGGIPDASTVKRARDALGALHFKVPPTGWDAFDGDLAHLDRYS
jgi:hypothetical protein